MFCDPVDPAELRKKLLFPDLQNEVTFNAYVLDSSCLCDNYYNQITKPKSLIGKVVMDICRPLSELKRKLEQKLYKCLSGYVFVLFDSHTMNDYTRLLDGPLETKEMRIVTAQIWRHSKTINILEVRKESNTDRRVEQSGTTSEDALSTPALSTYLTLDDVSDLPFDPKKWNYSHVQYWVQQICRHIDTQDIEHSKFVITGKELMTAVNKSHFQNILPEDRIDVFWKHLVLLRASKVIEENILLEDGEASTSEGLRRDYFRNWLVAFNFQKIQVKANIPANPEECGLRNLEQILRWEQWALCCFNMETLNLLEVTSGTELMKLTRKEFMRMMPEDPGDVFWVHLQLLVKTKIVALVQQESYKNPVKANSTSHTTKEKYNLWLFLLKLLKDPQYRNLVGWDGEDKEFELRDLPGVLKAWNDTENNPKMNLEEIHEFMEIYDKCMIISRLSEKIYRFEISIDDLI